MWRNILSHRNSYYDSASFSYSNFSGTKELH